MTSKPVVGQAGVQAEKEEAGAGRWQALEAEEKIGWSRNKALAILAAVTIALAIMSEVLTGALDPAAEKMHLTPRFAGVFLLALVGNAAELFNAIRFARKDKMDLAIGITVGASTQVALLVAPILVFAGYFMGRDMNLLVSPLRDVGDHHGGLCCAEPDLRRQLELARRPGADRALLHARDRVLLPAGLKRPPGRMVPPREIGDGLGYSWCERRGLYSRAMREHVRDDIRRRPEDAFAAGAHSSWESHHASPLDGCDRPVARSESAGLGRRRTVDVPEGLRRLRDEPVGGRAPRPAYMAGLGSYARGQGVYQLDKAKADAINADTMIKWNKALRARQAALRADEQKEAAEREADREARARAEATDRRDDAQ